MIYNSVIQVNARKRNVNIHVIIMLNIILQSIISQRPEKLIRNIVHRDLNYNNGEI